MSSSPRPRGSPSRRALSTSCSSSRIRAFAAGNLAVISLRANQAKGNMRWDEARTLAVLAEARTSVKYSAVFPPERDW